MGFDGPVVPGVPGDWTAAKDSHVKRDPVWDGIRLTLSALDLEDPVRVRGSNRRSRIVINFQVHRLQGVTRVVNVGKIEDSSGPGGICANRCVNVCRKDFVCERGRLWGYA